MIRSFADNGLEDCWYNGNFKSVKAELRKRTIRKLDLMDAATCLEDLRHPPNNDLHPLKGKYAGFWAIRVNAPWKLIFQFEESGPYLEQVELIQYH